jgi:hypothetical protein
MHSLTSAGLSIDEAGPGDPNRRLPVSPSGRGGLSIIRLKQEKCHET